MAGFQVANFNFGQNIVKNRLEAARIASQNAASARSAAVAERSAAVAERGQDIQAQQNEARLQEAAAQREEGARQFDARNAEVAAMREEQTRRFDVQQDRDERRYADTMAEKSRVASWDDALKQQQMEKEELAYQKISEELNRIMSIRQKEDEEREHRRQATESNFGNAIIATELGGGFLSPGQVEDFNSMEGTEYNYIGKIDPTTGKNYSDGKIHFVTYNCDDNGQAIRDPKTGRPTVLEDNAIGSEFYSRVMTDYFGSVSRHNANGSTIDERMALQDRIDERQNRAIAARERANSDANMMRLRTLRARDISNADKDVAAYEKSLRGAKKTGGIPAFSEEEIQQKVNARMRKHAKRIQEDYGDPNYYTESGKEGSSEAYNSEEAETWGSLTPEQTKRAKARGCTYDPDTNELVSPTGERMGI